MSFKSLMIGCGLLLASCARPVADFAYMADNTNAPSQVTFENTSQRAVSYTWDFGDGKQSTDAQPSHRYLASGNYEIELIATNEKGKQHSKKQRIMITPPEKCLIRISTPHGDMIAELFDETPQHRDNFIKLAEEGYYNDLLFHRVIEGFMIQGGDPKSKGADRHTPLGGGGPGYKVPAEFNPDLVHTKGALAAARQGDQVNPTRASSGSQFYIVQGQPTTADRLQQIARKMHMTYSDAQIESYTSQGGTPFLDGQYTVFGRVVEGLEVIDKIASQKTLPGDRPDVDVPMQVEVIK